MKLQQINALDKQTFVQTLGNIYEHSPWVAQRVYDLRPFASLDELHQRMIDIVQQADKAEQQRLILSHPELAGSEARSGQLTRASRSEQAGAGLDQCSADELARLQSLNARYRERFGFPFIIAVKGLTRYDIMAAMEQRLAHDATQEFRRCLDEIGKIARFRLQQLIEH